MTSTDRDNVRRRIADAYPAPVGQFQIVADGGAGRTHLQQRFPRELLSRHGDDGQSC